MPTANSKPVQVQYFPVLTPEDMVSTMKLAKSIGYYGTITMGADGAWAIRLTGPGNESITGKQGEVFIWNTNSLAVLSQAAFLAAYTPVP